MFEFFCVVSLLIFASFCVDICVDFRLSFSFIYCLFILAPVLFALLTSFPCVCVLKFSSFVGDCLCLFCWSFESALFSCLHMLFQSITFCHDGVVVIFVRHLLSALKVSSAPTSKSIPVLYHYCQSLQH